MFKDFTNYEIYEDGRIWSYKTKRFLKPVTNHNGYQVVSLYDNKGKMKNYRLHRVVYEAVTGNPIPEGMQCNHIDEDKTNCSFCNLNLLTCKENINFGTRNERMAKTQSKQVGAYRDGELIMVFPSAKDTHRQGFNRSAVSMCCNGKRKTHKGFQWKYL